MENLNEDDAIIDWARDYPAAISIFEHYGIDYSCGGKSLVYACEQCGVDPHQIISEILATLVKPENGRTTDHNPPGGDF